MYHIRTMRRNKYHNRKVTFLGVRFDSEKEAHRYATLRILERAGEIKGLKLQPRFELQPAFKCYGKTIRKIEYVADFSYYEHGKLVVEDVKGMETDVYKLKKKLFLRLYGDKLEFKEVR